MMMFRSQNGSRLQAPVLAGLRAARQALAGPLWRACLRPFGFHGALPHVASRGEGLLSSHGSAYICSGFQDITRLRALNSVDGY